MKGSIVLIGFMGSGKSTVGRALAERLEMRLYDTDELVEQAAGRPIAQIFDTEGEAAFRDLEHRMVRRAVRYGGRVIACGGGAILELRNHELLKAAGPVVYLEASEGALRTRLRGTAGARPLLRAPGALEKLLATRSRAYMAAADLVVNADAPVEDVVEQIVTGLR